VIERMIELSVRNRAVVLVLAALLALAGVVAVRETPVDAIPDLSENQVVVLAEWPGKTPREVEDQLTYPLSTALQGLAGVRAVRATSELGTSLVTVIFEDATELYFARARVLERLTTLKGALPDGVAPALAPDASALGQVLWYVLESDRADPGELRAVQDFYVRPRLSSVEGVAEVASAGGFVREVQVHVDPERLRARGLPLGSILEALARANLSAGGDVLERDGAELLVRADGLMKDPRDLEGAVLAVKDGVPVLLSHVARVSLGPAPRRGVLTHEGREAVGGVVVMRHGENPLAVTERVRERLASLGAGLPEGVTARVVYERTRLVRAAIDTLTRTLAEEMLVTALVVLLVLRHAGGAFVIVATLPLATLAAFICMRAAGVTSNIMSLSGIAISVGVLVDAGIVMTEAAYARLHERFGDAPVTGDTREVVLPALRAVGRPLFFSVMIMVLSFLPVFALSGMEGKMFRPLALTKTFALLSVALLAITLVPALVPTFLRGRLRDESSVWLVRSVAEVYRPVLAWLLPRPGLVGVLIAALLGAGAYVAPKMGREFMPPLDEGALMDMPVTTPNASVVSSVEALLARDALLRALPEVEDVLGKAGRADTATDPAPLDMVESIVVLLPREEWPRRALAYEVLEAAARRALPSDEGAQAEVAMAASAAFDRAARDLARTRLRESAARGDRETAREAALRALDHEIQDRAPALVVAALAEAARETGHPDLRFEAPAGRVDLRRKSKAELVQELDTWVDVPGWSNIWTQPIVNRIDMLATGVRTMVGVKVSGADPEAIQRAADEVARALRDVPGAVDVVADQTTGEGYVEVIPDRARAARYGIDVADVTDLVEAGVGGRRIGTWIDGRQRTPVRARLVKEAREGPEALARLPITPRGGRDGAALTTVPLSAVAEVRRVVGPSMVKSEDGLLRAYVQCNVRDRDVAGFVAEARAVIAREVTPPAGVSLEWTGQFEHEERARRTLVIVVPAVLAVMALLLLLTYGDAADASLVLLAVPGALAGGLIFQYLFGFRHSVATAVGTLVCFGLAVETGMVMLVYLREAIERRGGLAAIPSREALREAVLEGAVKRLRPKLLTEATTILGLVPMLWADGVGAEIMRPMAAPVLGGILVADEVIDVFLPVLFLKIRERRWERERAAAGEPEVIEEARS